MPRRSLILIASVALVALAGCADPPPPEFVSKEYKFKVRFGSEPKVIDQPTGGIPSRLFIVETASGAYTVRVFELPVTEEAATRESATLLDQAKIDSLRSVGGTQTKGESTTLAGKYPGRSFTATAAHPQPGVLQGRVYLAGTRLYKVTVFGTEEFANSPAAGAFLESFMVLE